MVLEIAEENLCSNNVSKNYLYRCYGDLLVSHYYGLCAAAHSPTCISRIIVVRDRVARKLR